MRTRDMNSLDELERLVAKRGSFHVARAAAFLLRRSDQWHSKELNLKQELLGLEASPEKLEAVIPQAYELLVGVVKSSPSHTADVDRALKSAALDKDIDKRLHT